MQTHDQKIAEAAQMMVDFCRQMSSPYISDLLEELELMLVSRHQSDNIIVRRFYNALAALSVGSALSAVRKARLDLCAFRLPRLTLRSIRDVAYTRNARATAWNAWVEKKSRPSLQERFTVQKPPAHFLGLDMGSAAHE